MRRLLTLAIAVLALSGCARDSWPEPPAVDQAQYQKDFDAWREEHRQGLSYTLPILGIWPLQEGETPFGSDPAVPVPLPAKHFPPRAGVLRRVGGEITVVPAPGRRFVSRMEPR